METKVFENNIGQVAAVVYDGGNPVNVIYDLECMEMYGINLIHACMDNFPDAEQYDPEQNYKFTLQEAADEVESWTEILRTDADAAHVYLDQMGMSGRVLFEM